MANPPSTPAQNAFKRIARLNGEADWHASMSYEDADLKQVVSLRPAYESTDNPNDGTVALHAVAVDTDGKFSELMIEVPVTDLRRLCKQVESLLDTDQDHYIEQARIDDETSDDDDDDDDDDEEEDDEEEGADEEEEEGDDDKGADDKGEKKK